MSFRRDYLPFFGIHVLDHDNGTPADSITVRPTSRCREILSNHQLLWQPRPHGVEVFYTLNPWHDDPLLGRITARMQLDFSLQLPAGFFAGYLPDFGDEKQLHLFNLSSAGNIRSGNTVRLSRDPQVSAADAIRILPARFELPIGIPAGTSHYEVRRQFGNTVLQEIPVEELGSGERQTFDLRQLDAGRVRLNPDNLPDQQTHLLLHNELAAGRAQAMVSIVMNQAQELAPTGGYRFEARFRAR